jgi:hypothetical protein
MLEAERTGMPFLYWRDGGEQLEILILKADRTQVTVGRRETCGIPLPFDTQVSRLHATIELVGEDWTVVDENSTNGSWINGARLSGRQPLRSRGHMTFGETRVDYAFPGHETGTTTRTPDTPTGYPLSERKRKVLIALCRPIYTGGSTTPATNPQIADELHVAVDTVKGTLKELFDQFGLGALPQNEKRSRLVAIVRDYRLLAPHDF